MFTNDNRSNTALELEVELNTLKSMATPDQERIKRVRDRIDESLEEQAINIREWRKLIEQCSRIRRSQRN
jgi:hypothetical protein